MVRVVAMCKLRISDPEHELNVVGHDDDGNPVVRKASLTVAPGDFFDFPEGEELLNLLKMEAVREPTQADLAEYNRARGAA